MRRDPKNIQNITNLLVRKAVYKRRRRCRIAPDDGKRDAGGGVRVRAGGRAVFVRAVLPGLLSGHPHLHSVVRLEDDSEETAGLPLGVRLALRRLLRLRSVERLPLRLGRVRRSGSDLHFRQHQLVLLDCGHRCLPVRFHREVQPKSRRQPGAGVPPRQVSLLHYRVVVVVVD